jgi:hypothetical protein
MEIAGYFLYMHIEPAHYVLARASAFITQSLLCLRYHKVHYIQLQTARLLASQD